MRKDLQYLVDQYKIELSFLELRYKEEAQANRRENHSLFFGQWQRLGIVICDLEGFMRLHFEVKS
jgi:hypothetical protein